jgi:hypothetical protein
MSDPDMPSANEDEFLAKVKARMLAPWAPDGDWLPFLAFEDDSGGLTGAPLSTPQAETEKDLLAVAVAHLAGLNNPRFIAVVFAAWAVFNEPGVRPSTSPAREEWLTISHASRTTEPGVCMAPITRSRSRPPVLGQWITFCEAGARGRWADALRAALAFAAVSAKKPELMPAAHFGPKEASYRERVLLAKFLGIDPAIIRREPEFAFTLMNDLERSA